MASIAEALAIALDHLLAGRLAEAAELCRRVRAAAPEEANAWHLGGLAEGQGGSLERAAAFLERTVALAPQVAEYRLNLAKARAGMGRGEEAARDHRRALALAPETLESAMALGELDPDGGRAVAALRRALALGPALGEAWRRLAARTGGEGDGAAVRRALRLVPGNGALWRRLALALRERGEHGPAAAALERALALDPADAAALGVRANALKDMARLVDSLSGHDRAVRAGGGDPTLLWNRAMARLLAGDLAGGFADYEHRWRAQGFPTRERAFPAPPWPGGDPAGKTILVHEEQGRGDAIQFVRFVPLLAARGARVVLEVGADLVALMRTLPGAAAVVATGAPPPPVDAHCPVMSLPHRFGATLETAPAEVPYLAAEPARVAAWRGRLPDGRLRVGVVWQGNPEGRVDRGRSYPLACLEPLARIPGIRLVSLQKLHGLDQLDALPAGMAVTTLGPDLDAGPDAFVDTAAVMECLDLVVTSDTATAHLAGALGRPVWVLLPFVPDWRWLMGRDDSPWYPTMRLFRQERPGDWASAAARVAGELARLRPASDL